MRVHCAAALIAVVFACTMSVRAADDWPQWRGPARDGISTDTGLLRQWDEAPPLVWKASGLGAGFSSVSVADGRIYTMGDRDDAQLLIALDGRNGRELWATRIGDVWEPGGYAGPRATPTVDGNRIYAIGPHGDLICVEARTGREVWRKNFRRDFDGKMMSGWGFAESPLVDGEKLVCTPGGPQAGMVALDKRNGREIWRCAFAEIGESGNDGAAYSSIVISHGGGVKQYVQLAGRGVVGVDAERGRFLWGYNRIANGTANIPTPIVRDDYVFCSTGYGTGAALLRLVPAGGSVEAEEVYFLDSQQLQNHHGGMVLVGDYLYGGHGHNQGFPVCVHWQTGENQWDRVRGPGSGSAAVAFADGQLYFRYQDGIVALIEATPEGFQLNGQFQLPDVDRPSWPHPVVAGGRLYLREQDALYCYDVDAR
ncbi:MAG: PQQ-binding-like beta-propeller repeat protein [Pirellulales bacterium]